MRVDMEGAVQIACLAAGFDWDWTKANVERFCRHAGWQSARTGPTGTGPEYARFRTSLRIATPIGEVEYDPEFFERRRIHGAEVREIVVYLTDLVDESSPTGRAFLVDTFAELAERLSLAFGLPSHRVNDINLKVVWTLPRAVFFLAIDRQDGSIGLRIVNPVYQDHLNRLAREYRGDDDFDDEDFDDDEDSEDSLAQSAEFPSTWPDFVSALALTLTRLPVDGILALTASGGDTGVWFEMGWHELQCLVTWGDGHSQEHHAKAVDLGWSTAAPIHHANWERSISWPAPYRACEALAEGAVIILREVLEVAQPTDLQLVAGNDSDSDLMPDVAAFLTASGR
ncbi:DUF6301 family protein [Nocardia sp. NPDC050406]|uniref:DUF6301 family protein n=1 Tax=Nocardia sp. NPDC050406 TaxID=3364318 RepID=UPI0037B95A5C